jgi:hypothetical protein
MARMLVCGGREYGDWDTLKAALDEIHGQLGTLDCVIHGNEYGADRMAGVWAAGYGIQEVRCPANWHHYRNSAGPIRNSAMLALEPSIVVAFPGGRGTQNMVLQATREGVRVVTVTESGELLWD